MTEFRLPNTVIPGCMVCGRDLGAEYTVKCTGSSVEWYCPEHSTESAWEARAHMVKMMEAVNGLYRVLGGDPSLVGFSPEFRTLADGYGGQTTDTRTGVTASVGRPGTRQRRWVTEWENVDG